MNTELSFPEFLDVTFTSFYEKLLRTPIYYKVYVCGTNAVHLRLPIRRNPSDTLKITGCIIVKTSREFCYLVSVYLFSFSISSM